MPRLTTARPSWVPIGAKYHFDYANRRYYNGNIWEGKNNGTAPAQYNTSSMFYNGSSASANTLFTQWKNGKVVAAGASQNLRISDYGLWSEGGTGLAHNYALQCRDFTNAAWTKTTMTAAKDQVGVDGVTNAASSLTATAGAGAAVAVQTLSFTSKLFTVSAWIKRITGTGTIGLSLDGTTYTDVSGSVNSTTYTQVHIGTATSTNPTVGVNLGTNGDKIAIDFFQAENDDTATSPILSVGTVNLRGAEYPTFGTQATQFNDGLRIINDIDTLSPFSIVVGYSGNFSTTLGHGIIVGGGTNPIVISGAAGGGVVTATYNGGSNASTNSDVSGLFTLNKVAVSIGGTASTICVNGGAVTAGTCKTRTGAPTTSHIAFGNNGSNILPMNGYIKFITIYKRELTASEMKAVTKVTEPN